MKPKTPPDDSENPDVRNAPFEAGGNPGSDLKTVHVKDPPVGFRRLRENEVVSPGDYVLDDLQRVEPGEGPGGFRADSFVKQIYRRVTAVRLATRRVNE